MKVLLPMLDGSTTQKYTRVHVLSLSISVRQRARRLVQTLACLAYDIIVQLAIEIVAKPDSHFNGDRRNKRKSCRVKPCRKGEYT